jgi:hypothetical protein
MRPWILLALVALSACGEDEPTAQEQAEEADRSTAMVERANNTLPPLHEVTPEPIGAPEIERYDLYGAACNYAPGTSLGTRVVARESDAFLKIEGEVVRLAADAGARELPLRTRSLYNGREHVLRLRIVGGDEPAGTGAGDYEGAVTLFDQHGRVIYEGAGLTQCRE